MTAEPPVGPRLRLALTDPPRDPGRLAASGADGIAGGDAAEVQVRLRLLATTDVHAQLLSYDYYSNRAQFGFGLAQTASLIATARAEVPGAVLLDNGDFLQGSALSELAALPRRRRPHPVIAAMNALHYDAAALGNHEFNYGLDLLMQALSGARFPVLSANVARRLGPTPTEDLPLVPPFAVIDRDLPDAQGCLHRVRVGVLALTPPQILDWDRSQLQGHLQTRPMLDAARAWLPRLRQAGADVVVCLAHTGISGATPLGREQGLAVELAELPGIDAIVAGHSHLVFPDRDTGTDPRIDPARGRIAGVPAVQPGHSGSHLGVIDLDLVPGPQGWTVRHARSQARSASEIVAGLPARVIRRHAAPVQAAVKADHRAALAWTRRSLGRTAQPLSTYFATVADVAALHLIAAAKTACVRARLQGRDEAALPLLAMASAFRAGGRGGPLNYTDIPAGPLSVRNVFDLYSFPNRLVARVVTGAQVVELLEASAALYCRIQPGRADQFLIPRDVPGFAFSSIPGLDYRIDLAQPAWPDGPGRIRDLTLDGRPLPPAQRVVLVTNSYRAAGEPLIPDTSPDLLCDTPILVTDAIADHLRRDGAALARTGAGWSFAPVPGASVLFDTGPEALRHLADVAAMRPELIGLTEAGFHRFRLHL